MSWTTKIILLLNGTCQLNAKVTGRLWKRTFSTCRILSENGVVKKRLERPKSSRLFDPSTTGEPKISKGYYALLVVPCVTFCLGVWQIQRRAWKLDLLEKLKTRTQSTKPIPFPDNPEVLLTPEWEYFPVEVTGTFDHSRELLVRPRSPRQDEEDEDEFRNPSEGPARSGANVVTAFNVKDRDLRILVNRGWVSSFKLDPKKRKKGQVKGEQTIVGIVRRSERRVAFNKNQPENNMWFYRDQEHMARELNTSPIFIDLVEECTPDAPHSPLGGQTRVNLRNEHGTYIFIWFSLSLFTFYMWFKRSGLRQARKFNRMKQQYKL